MFVPHMEVVLLEVTDSNHGSTGTVVALVSVGAAYTVISGSSSGSGYGNGSSSVGITGSLVVLTVVHVAVVVMITYSSSHCQ